jgi:CIC family chloride channel protein
MGALLAASVRAPLTGIVLVLEMTDNYQLILPMIITIPVSGARTEAASSAPMPAIAKVPASRW